MIDYQREFGVVCCTYQRVRVIFSKSHTSNIRSASFTKISTTNHCAYITQKILTQSFHTHYTSYITTEKNHRLLNRIHCFDIFYQFLNRICTTILTVQVPQILRNVRVHLVLANSSLTCLCRRCQVRLGSVSAHFFSIYVFHPQNTVTLNNSPSVKFSSPNFALIYLDNMARTSTFASVFIFILHRQQAHFPTITEPVTYIVSYWMATHRAQHSLHLILV